MTRTEYLITHFSSIPHRVLRYTPLFGPGLRSGRLPLLVPSFWPDTFPILKMASVTLHLRLFIYVLIILWMSSTVRRLTQFYLVVYVKLIRSLHLKWTKYPATYCTYNYIFIVALPLIIVFNILNTLLLMYLIDFMFMAYIASIWFRHFSIMCNINLTLFIYDVLNLNQIKLFVTFCSMYFLNINVF